MQFRKLLLPILLAAGTLFLAAACGKEGPAPVDPDDPQEETDPQPDPGDPTRMDIMLRTPGCHNIAMSYLGNREYQLIVDGGDPYIFSAKLFTAVSMNQVVLEFDYKSTYDIDNFQIFYALGSSPSENSSQRYGKLPATESYKHFQADILPFLTAGWGRVGDCLRFDPGSSGPGIIHIRNLRIRAITEEEKRAAEEEADRIANEIFPVVAKTLTWKAEVEGARISWENQYGVPLVFNAMFKDVTGSVRTVSKTSSTDDFLSFGAFTEPTQVSVTVSTRTGASTEPVRKEITPRTGEIPTDRMTFPRYSSIWNKDTGFDKMLDRDTDTYWHSDLTSGEQWFVADLGTPHKVNAIEAIRRKTDAGYGSAIRYIQVSVATEDKTDAYRIVVPKTNYHPSKVYAGHLYTFDETPARYIKVEFSTEGSWCHLAEFLVYFAPDPAAVSPYAKRTD
ncbi:MAG: discoidin domain-containing protein [Bacteroidales bacterium]|nr:discoidin domain-containing protein [Bacteroidales bacterium]